MSDELTPEKMDILAWIRDGGAFKEFAMEVTKGSYEDLEAREITTKIAHKEFGMFLAKMNLKIEGTPLLEWLEAPSFDYLPSQFMLCKLTAKVVRGE